MNSTTVRCIGFESLRRSGKLGNEAEIFSENSSGRFPMTVGAKYLLLIYAAQGRMHVDYCGNSGLVSERGPELQQVERLAAKR
jgi:hypothetical protein